MFCKICEKNQLEKAFSLGKQPLANKYPRDDFEIGNEKLYEMDIFFCNNCLSCKIDVDISRDIFFQDYFYLSSVNKELVEHFEDLALELKDKKFVLDIGSNDGILLKPLKQYKVKFLGIDPSENVGKIANSNGLTTLISFFNQESSKEIIKIGGRPDCIVASSVFTHLEDPLTFIEDVYNLLDDNGTFIIEVEYLKNILEQVQFERFYFDRPFYYSLHSLQKLFDKKNMKIIDVKHIKAHGGSIRVYLKKNKVVSKISENVLSMLREEKNKLSMAYAKSCFNIFKSEIKILKDNLENFKLKNLNVIGYGAPARLATITNFGKIDKNLIKFIIDDSPLKVNRFTPGSHIPIKNYEAIKDNFYREIILFAYEYYSSIKSKFLNKDVNFYKPIPMKKL